MAHTLSSVVGLAKLQIQVPEGQRLFIWSTGESVTPITAKDEDEAFRKVIAFRMTLVEGTEQERLEEALAWHRKNDTLLEVDCDELEVEPYKGELPEDDEESFPIEN
jgi:hypothetical protein